MRAKIAWLVAVAVAAFALQSPLWIGLLFGLQIALFFAARLPLRLLGRSLRRPSVFILVVCLSIVLFPERCQGELYRTKVLGLTVQLCAEALWHALLMAARIYTVILASALVRSRDSSGEFVRALSAMGLPRLVALPLDAALGYLAPAGAEPGGGGGGGGRGRRRARGGAESGEGEGGPPRRGLRELLRGGWAGALRDSLHRYLDWSERALRDRHGQAAAAELVDATILAALTILAMLVRYLQAIPNVPFAPGYKGIVHIPLFIIAAQTVQAGFGGTKLGAVTGIIGFMTGQGGYGLFDVAKQIAPGLLADLLVFLFRGKGRSLNVVSYVVIGALVGAGRFATMVLITTLMDAPRALYALLGPVLLSQCLFGAASGVVSKLLVAAILQWRSRRVAQEGAPAPAESHTRSPPE